MMEDYQLRSRLGWQGHRFRDGKWPPPLWKEELDVSGWMLGRIDSPRYFVNYHEDLLEAKWPMHLQIEDPRITGKHFWRIHAICTTVIRTEISGLSIPVNTYVRRFVPCTMATIIGGPKKIADVFSRHLSMTVALGVAVPEARKTTIRTKVRPIMLE